MNTAAGTQTISEDRLAALAKALGHPARVRILNLLGARASCVTSELAPALGLAASTVSEHLRILREAGLIETESAEGRPCYCLKEDGLQSLIAGVHGLTRAEPGSGSGCERPSSSGYPGKGSPAWTRADVERPGISADSPLIQGLSPVSA